MLQNLLNAKNIIWQKLYHLLKEKNWNAIFVMAGDIQYLKEDKECVDSIEIYKC